MPLGRTTTIGVILPLLLETGAAAQPPPDRALRVGTKETPPFSIKQSDGSWRGLSIELWQEIAAELELTFELREYDLPGLLGGLKQGSIDVAVAALTVTQEREEWCDFSHPFHSAGLGIAVKPHGGSRWRAVLMRLLSREFLGVIGLLLLLILAVGAVVWILERRRNPDQFGGTAGTGILAGLWWSAVTMTTVGYGDKAPRTFGGRVVAIVWMFAGIILISFFTATVTSAITVTELTSAVQGPGDLPKVRVGTVPDTTSADVLRRRGVPHQGFTTPLLALEALVENRVDAVVYDGPILRYLAGSRLQQPVKVLPTMLDRQDYALGLVADSPLRERINRILLRKIADTQWEQKLRRYLGGGG